ncbi:MAG: hypothetical protein R3B84_00565 [Zavarzinella sp.]
MNRKIAEMIVKMVSQLIWELRLADVLRKLLVVFLRKTPKQYRQLYRFVITVVIAILIYYTEKS